MGKRETVPSEAWFIETCMPLFYQQFKAEGCSCAGCVQDGEDRSKRLRRALIAWQRRRPVAGRERKGGRG